MRRKIQSTGFGESQVTSTAPAEEVAELNNTSLTGIPPRSVWTVGGVPVNEHPDGYAITYEMTDQAIAEKTRKRQELVEEGWPQEVVNNPRLKTPLPAPLQGLENASDPDDKAILEMAQKMADFEFDPAVFSVNPLEIKASRYIKPGMAPYWGAERDADMDKMRGFRPVLGPGNEPVKHGELTLLHRPQQIRDYEMQHLARMTNEQTLAITQSDEGATEKHFRDDLGLSESPASLRDVGLGLKPDSPTFG